MSTNMSLFNRMPNNNSTNQLNHTNSYNSLNSMFTPSNTNVISHDLQELTNQLSYLNEKISTKDKQIKDLTDRIVKLETQNHILKDEIKIIKDGSVSGNPNPSNPNLGNINVNRHMINSNGGHIASNPSCRIDLNDEMVLSPDMGNYALAEQASAQKSVELDYSLNLYNMQGMQNMQTAMQSMQGDCTINNNNTNNNNLIPTHLDEFKNITYPQDIHNTPESTMYTPNPVLIKNKDE